MAKKKKKGPMVAWAEEDEEACTPARRGKAGRQTSRKQQRRAAAAAWEEGSDTDEPLVPATTPLARPSQSGLRLALGGVTGDHGNPGMDDMVRRERDRAGQEAAIHNQRCSLACPAAACAAEVRTTAPAAELVPMFPCAAALDAT